MPHAAYPIETKEKAHWLWLRGYTYVQIAVDLSLPRWKTVYEWCKRYKWEETAVGFREAIGAEVAKKQIEQIAEDEAGDLAIIDGLQRHIKANIMRHVDNKPDILPPKSLQALASSLDTLIRRKRIIRQGHDTIDRSVVETVSISEWKAAIEKMTSEQRREARDRLERGESGNDILRRMGLVGSP